MTFRGMAFCEDDLDSFGFHTTSTELLLSFYFYRYPTDGQFRSASLLEKADVHILWIVYQANRISLT